MTREAFGDEPAGVGEVHLTSGIVDADRVEGLPVIPQQEEHRWRQRA